MYVDLTPPERASNSGAAHAGDREGTSSSEDILDLATWIQRLRTKSNAIDNLEAQSAASNRELGFVNTLREIVQQPLVWRETIEVLRAAQEQLAGLLPKGGAAAIQSVTLTGSGSSLFVGECVRRFLQDRLGVACEAIAGGDLLLSRTEAVPLRPRLVVSFARSGDSPESVGAVETLLETESDCHHVVITCNREGRLASKFTKNPRVTVLVLPDSTCDRSLVMTSSFTSMALACRALGYTEEFARYAEHVEATARVASEILLYSTDALGRVARSGFSRAIYLGGRARLGSAHESALKMLEMTEGRVATMSESFLGLRHGPMSFLREDSLLVCFLSSDRLERAYELDLLAELDKKCLGARRVLVGADVATLKPGGNAPGGDALNVSWSEEIPLGLDGECIPGVMVGQLLAFFRCLAEGLNPDAPSPNGVIGRVVGGFQIHPVS